MPGEDYYENAKYNVRFNSDVAYTLIYEDPVGTLLFIFEIGETSKHVILHRIPLENQIRVKTPTARSTQALARAKEFLANRGYIVEVS